MICITRVAENSNSSTAVRALGQTIGLFSPACLGARGLDDASMLRVVSYGEDFEALWALGDDLLDWLLSGSRHVYMIWGEPKRVVGPRSRLIERLTTPYDWAALATLRAFERCTDVTWRLTVVDFALGRRSEASVFDERERALRSRMPHVATSVPRNVLAHALLALLQSPPAVAWQELLPDLHRSLDSGLRDLYARQSDFLLHELGPNKRLPIALTEAAATIRRDAIASERERIALACAWDAIRKDLSCVPAALRPPALNDASPALENLDRWISEVCNGSIAMARLAHLGPSLLASLVRGLQASRQ